MKQNNSETKFYDKNYYEKNLYGFSSLNREDHKEILSLVNFTNKKVLDIGCGLGSLLKILDIPNKNKFGVESNPYAVKACKKDGLNVIQAENIYKLPYEDTSFDIIIMNEVIEHIEHPYLIIEEIYRLLKKDGRIVITTPNRGILVNNLDPSHLSEMSYKELEKNINKFGFKIEIHKVSGISIYDYIGRKFIFPIGRFILEKTKTNNKAISTTRDIVDHSNISKFRTKFKFWGAQQLLIAKKK